MDVINFSLARLAALRLRLFVLALGMVGLFLYAAGCSGSPVEDADGEDPGPEQVSYQITEVLTSDGPVFSLAYAAPSMKMFAGIYGAQNLFSSDDGGSAWSYVPGIPSNFITVDVRRHATSPHVVVSAADRGEWAASVVPSSIYVSRDNGATWADKGDPSKIAPAEFHYRIQDVALHPQNAEIIYVLTSVLQEDPRWRFIKSEDFGDTWTLLATFDRQGAEPPVLLTTPANPEHVVIGAGGSTGQSGGLYSTDGGRNWQGWSMVATERLYGIDGAGRLYGRSFAGSTSSSNQQLVRSADRGQTWTVLFETDKNIVNVATHGRDLIALLLEDEFRLSLDGGVTWMSRPPFAPGLDTANLPDQLEVIRFDAKTAELLLSFQGSSLLSPGKLRKITITGLGS